MKLPDFYNFEPLNAIKSRMGIARNKYGDLKVKVKAGRLTELELEQLISPGGLEVSFDQITILKDGTLAYKNSRVLLYIRDVAVYPGKTAEPRFHVSNCRTLQRMQQGGRFDRYVISTRTDGRFSLNFIEYGKKKSQLYDLCVCQNCLEKLGFDGFSVALPTTRKKEFVRSFKLERFFEKYPLSLHLETPKYNSDNAPINEYPKNWSEISSRARQDANWKCQRCGIDLYRKEYRQYLHVHHKNGLKHDCSAGNLLVICVQCHADEPEHSHMKGLLDYKEFILAKTRLTNNY